MVSHEHVNLLTVRALSPLDVAVMRRELCLPALAVRTYAAPNRPLRILYSDVEAVQPDFSMPRLWQSWLTLRGFLLAGIAGGLYANPKLRAMMKPEAVWEIENGLTLSAADVFRASVDRSAWYQALNTLFQKYDFLVLPSAQVFPFDSKVEWPKSVNGKAMDTYHRWMEVVVGGTLAGVPVLNVPAGFGPGGLPMGLQVLGPAQADLAVLQVGHAYEQASGYSKIRSPLLA